MNMDKKEENVTSHNQQGGMTAHTVNAEEISQVTKVDLETKSGRIKNPWLVTVVGGVAVGIILWIILA